MESVYLLHHVLCFFLVVIGEAKSRLLDIQKI